MVILKRLLESNPADLILQRNLARVQARMSNTLTRRGKLAEALNTQEHALIAFERLVAREPNNEDFQRELAASLKFFGKLKSWQRKFVEALEPLERAVYIYRQLVSTDSKSYFPDLVVVLTDFGELLSRLGRRYGASIWVRRRRRSGWMGAADSERRIVTIRSVRKRFLIVADVAA